MMITAGIDVGNKNTRALILKDREVISRSLVLSDFDHKKAALYSYELALSKAHMNKEDVNFIMATGAGQEEVTFANGRITEVGSAARGAVFLFSSTRTVIDVGAEESRAIKIDEKGKVLDFAINEKCAAGTGSFVESMSRALEITLEEMGALSLKGEKSVPMNAQCAVFAESEVVSLIHARIPVENIAKSIHEAMASRISSMVRRIGIQKEVLLIGGTAYNKGFIAAMEEDLELKLIVPADYPEFISAFGAALVAADKAGGK